MLNALWQCLFTVLIRQLVEVEDGAKKHDYREYDDDAAHNLVDDEYSVVVEFASYRVDKPCQTEPPKYRSEQDANITHAHFNGTVGHDKGELREKEYEKEYDKRVGERDKECSKAVVQKRSFTLFHALVQFLRGVWAVAVDAEDKQKNASAYLKQKSVALVVDEIHYETHSESSEQSIYDVADRCRNACNEAIPTPFVQCALYAKHPDRTHRGRCHDANKNPLENEVQYVYLYRKLHNECKIANFMRYRQIFAWKLCAITVFLIPLSVKGRLACKCDYKYW